MYCVGDEYNVLATSMMRRKVIVMCASLIEHVPSITVCDKITNTATVPKISKIDDQVEANVTPELSHLCCILHDPIVRDCHG